MPSEIRLFIVDDSVVFRRSVQESIEGIPGVRFVGAAGTGESALGLIRLRPPDLVTLDLEMPGMDGLQVLREIQKLNRERALDPGIGVIMLSSHTQSGTRSTIEALEVGAFDFIAKPATDSAAESILQLRRELSTKIRNFQSQRKTDGTHTPLTPQSGSVSTVQTNQRISAPTRVTRQLTGECEAIVIGVSTGGPKALGVFLPQLTRKVRQPILIVQHMPEHFTRSLAESLSRQCPGTEIHEGEEGESTQAGTVYIAPGGRHMVLRRRGDKLLLGIHALPPENGCRPSVDVLFRSVAQSIGGRAIAVVMTGMGNDGAAGAASLRRAGSIVLAQDEESSVVWGMPGSAVAAGAVDAVVPLDQLANKITGLLKDKGP